MSKKTERGAQSSVELLASYGYAVLIIIIVASVLYILITVPSSIPSNQCSFSQYLTCKDVILVSNATSARAVFLLSNSQQYSIEQPSAVLNITGVGSYPGSCFPNYILSGGVVECIINMNKPITLNALINGNVKLTATVCTKITTKGCSSPVLQTYDGTFLAHVSQN